MALDAQFVDQVFARLSVRYGASFARQWEGFDLLKVRRDWGRELDGLTSAALMHGLDHLPPDYPPNSMQFRALCLRRPEPASLPLLPAPSVDRERVREIVGRLGTRPGARDPLAWARALRERETTAGSVSLTAYQRQAWREVLPERHEETTE